ncbi:ComF family protein [Neobacillus niacini]|uniref:ComF family protein n=1 Tax=Neobacillus niacini TaxID=86668 RepID=UPI0007ABCE26|nr:ComF family protein [Neobacillus niacini]MEC1523422.1 ComF family protein [Neobacillus niacini]
MKLFPQAQCLICHEMIQPEMGWKAIFSVEKELILCSTCERKFEMIEGEQCKLCSRPFQFLDERFRHGEICHDCKRWEEDDDWKGYLDSNHSIYLYNDFFKEVMAAFKFRGDYVLALIFAEKIKDYYTKIQPDLVVPIPLSNERLYERGFNQAAALLIESGLTPNISLTRIHSEKQSKKSRSERIHIPQVFEVVEQIELIGKHILLVDDIYTTGSTLRHAAKLLKESGAKRVQSLTLAR